MTAGMGMGTGSGASFSLRAPAKLNLGLEITGRRRDGYHDLATIFQATEPHDELTLEAAEGIALAVSDPSLGGPENLVLRALRLARERYSVEGGAAARLVKAIPAAAGIGGASSDAAAALLGARDLWRLPASDDELRELASEIGSDAPFFIRGGAAFASGRGEVLTPLPTPREWFVIVSPPIAIERKTATLYAALEPRDFSDGSDVREQAGRIRRGEPLEPALLVNAFTRALLELRPEMRSLREAMERCGARPFLSGAGPTHYAMFDGEDAARRAAAKLRAEVGARTAIVVSPALPPRSGRAGGTASSDGPH